MIENMESDSLDTASEPKERRGRYVSWEEFFMKQKEELRNAKKECGREKTEVASAPNRRRT